MLERVMVDDKERQFVNKRVFLHLTNYTISLDISLSIAQGLK